MTGKSSVKAIKNKSLHDVQERKDRRMKLGMKSLVINNTNECPQKLNITIKGALKTSIENVLKENDFTPDNKISYGFKSNNNKKAKAGLAKNFKYHVFSKANKNEKVDTASLLVIQEVNNKIMEVKEYVRK